MVPNDLFVPVFIGFMVVGALYAVVEWGRDRNDPPRIFAPTRLDDAGDVCMAIFMGACLGGIACLAVVLVIGGGQALAGEIF